MNTLKAKFSGFRLTRRAFAYPYMAFLLIFVVLPLVLILVNAFLVDGQLSFENFATFFSSSSAIGVLGKSIVIGIITTLACLIIGYPVAYLLTKQSSGKIMVLLFVLPMWVNFLIRTLATKQLFISVGAQLGMGTVIFGMVYNYLPMMILPLHTTLAGIDKSYSEAAADLGADKFSVFTKTIFPLSLPGIISGITMVFIPTISTFAITELLSDRQIYLFGDSIQNMFAMNLYGLGSVMSLVMVILVLLSNAVISKVDNGNSSSGRALL